MVLYFYTFIKFLFRRRELCVGVEFDVVNLMSFLLYWNYLLYVNADYRKIKDKRS